RRTGPHGRPRLPATPAYRRAVPDLAEEDRLGRGAERPDGRGRDGGGPGQHAVALRPAGPGPVLPDAGVRALDCLYLHADADVGVGLAGAEPELDGNVVALLEPGALSEGDLRVEGVDPTARVDVYLHLADPIGLECPGARDGQGDRARPRGLHALRDGR